MIGIYCVTNKVNGKKYFGQSTDIERRKKDYFIYGKFPNDHLKNAFNKYGKENFDFEIIKCCKEKYLDRFEKLYIRINDTMNSKKGYNKEAGGCLNKHLSNETKKKISDAHTGKKLSAEHCKKMSEAFSGENNPFYGQKHTPESLNKMSEAKSCENNPMYGQKHTPETRKKMSENHKDNSGENHPMWGKYGKNHLAWKDYPRIIKDGKDKEGKQKYCIMYNGKKFANSIYKRNLFKKWYNKYPDIELVDKTE